MIKVITYGTFDLFHFGHLRLLERAKQLGDYLIVGVTADDFDRARGKYKVLQSVEERIEAIRKLGIADKIIIEEYEGQKIDDIKKYDVNIFTVGSDWKGAFDYLDEYCKVVYLKRTEGISSTEIRAKNGESRRIKGTAVDINSNEVLRFYSERAKKYKKENPYEVTMLQDNNPELVRERNRKQIEVILPFLSLDKDSRILDVACGIGRWYDAVDIDIKEYCGIDFVDNLIQIAKENHKDSENADFLTGSATELEQILERKGKGTYNRVLMIGCLMYFNDADIRTVLRQICHVTDKDTIFCIIAPVAISDRLTLKDFYSGELKDNYNAIYRTREECMYLFEEILIPAGFHVEKTGWVFEDTLNNRKETAQYYFVLRKQR